MTKRQLENQIRRFSAEIKKGDTINMIYDGEIIANYQFEEWSIDSKTPYDWLIGCLVFVVQLKGRDINKICLEFIKA